jgi:hypothetical protein
MKEGQFNNQNQKIQIEKKKTWRISKYFVFTEVFNWQGLRQKSTYGFSPLVGFLQSCDIFLDVSLGRFD